MYTIFRKGSRYKLRDINIAIAYHNSERTLKELGLEYGMSSQNIRRIHNMLVRHMARCVGLDNVYYHTERKNHSEEMSDYLQEYRCLLEESELKTEITLYNNCNDGNIALIISDCVKNDGVEIYLPNGRDRVEVSLDELKAALKKISAR